MAKDVVVRKHYGDKDGIALLSRNAVFNFVTSNRNFGKTWTFKKRAIRRWIKHGKKTIWIRLFDEEVKTCADKFLPRDFCKYAGVSMYAKQSKKGNIKREGTKIFMRRHENDGAPWDWVIQIFRLSDPDAVRSADDPDVDTIVVDERSKTAEKMNKYVGNPLGHLLDILDSVRREHEVKVILLGNKENHFDPLITGFGLRVPPTDWEGIRLYKGNSIALQQINNLPCMEGDYNTKIANALKGTAYGAYLYQNKYKGDMGITPKKTPPSAKHYINLNVQGQQIRIMSDNGRFFVNDRIDRTRPIYSLFKSVQSGSNTSPSTKTRVLLKRHKPYFRGFSDAISLGLVYYESERVRQAIEPFYQFLGL